MGLKTKLRKMLKIDPRVMRRIRKILAPIRRNGLKKQFTIFSNNCWGGRLYDKFSLPYLTPTIGLAMDTADFIKFLENYEYYFSLELKPIEDVQKQVNGEWGFYDCTLGDIKILFRHYRNVNDAITKWNRRKERIVKDNIIVKLTCYDDDVDTDVLDRFIKLPYKKILFLSDEELVKKYESSCRVVYIPKDKTDSEFVVSDSKLKLKEIKKIINA